MFKGTFLSLATAAVLVAGVAVGPTFAASRPHATMTMQVTMKAQAFSGVTGSATLTYSAATKSTTVKLTVKHLMAGTLHPAHIHAGTCSVNGAVLAALTSVKAGMNGIGTSTTVVPGSFSGKQVYINVHLGPGLALTGYTVLACGQIPSAM
jgi:hypothetical protein